jgi:3-isopropylmalate dehydrogenase
MKPPSSQARWDFSLPPLSEPTLRYSNPSTVHGRKQQGKTSPIRLATILSAAMMFEYAFKLKEEGTLIRKAVDASLDANIRTDEIQVEGKKGYRCSEVGKWIVDYINKQ